MDENEQIPPRLQLEKATAQAPKAGLGILPVAAAGFLCLLGLFAALPDSAGTAATNEAALKTGDHVPLEKRAQIDAFFSAYTGRLSPLLPEKERAAFFASPGMSAAQKTALWAEVERGDKKLAVITLWDNFDEDGDAVSVAGDGVTINVPLTHVTTRIYIPYKPGGNLAITGLRDGGGGVTAAIETLAGAVPLPILTVGQTIMLPLL